jgi:hypothetical protein
VTASPNTDRFPTEPSSIPGGVDPDPVEVSDGDAFVQRIAPVAIDGVDRRDT